MTKSIISGKKVDSNCDTKNLEHATATAWLMNVHNHMTYFEYTKFDWPTSLHLEQPDKARFMYQYVKIPIPLR